MKKIYIISIALILLFLIFYIRLPKPEIIHPQLGKLTESVYAISVVKSERNFTLRLGVLSSVEFYFVKEGDFVKAGERLLKTEGGTIFFAPHAGVVTSIPFGLKETIIPQSPIIKIVDLNNLYLEASIEQLAALKIKKGMNVIISFDDFKNNLFNGEVTAVIPRDPDFLLHIKAKNLPPNILPGMSADLSIEIGSKLQAITIPTKAISNGYIIRLLNNKKIKTKVEIGISDNENTEILNPILTPENQVVLPMKEKI